MCYLAKPNRPQGLTPDKFNLLKSDIYREEFIHTVLVNPPEISGSAIPLDDNICSLNCNEIT